MSRRPHITVIGAGAWGTALACAMAATGADVTLWMRNPVPPATRTLPRLPDVILPDTITITGDFPRTADVVLLVTPVQTARDVSTRLQTVLDPTVPVVTCCKGLEQATSLLPLDVLAQTMPNRPTGVLSGPNFAIEIAKGLPAAATLACADIALAQALTALLNTSSFRLYASDDAAGVQLAGAAKNVIAIGAGITIGAGLGENARAALITRAVAEIGRLAEATGGRASTLAGLAGMGDLILTCTSRGSRNYSVGLELGEGRSLADILASRTTVAEGVLTAPAMLALARRHNVRVPIIETVTRLLNEGVSIEEARHLLLDRPPTRE
ncbi:NAD(P)H-dependent glycerol-3-phosphate dehydrogenase [Gluconobacter kanchanaburiensis]|uniref:Glycerol-3-phosphate dehydrogenase [NAD(P)+] n=1 Tax=Gluconobacter kanchanaburiensis NBRC 103587 TaxID=1307948 RepID=A0A511B3S2_9PROT|nr:NAD(P)H-dependent glycerol-3-phosphate dehydrogenase [Gluconobacter kanchanaburiensis]GBR69697.1 glycerol-3-phosphate dehydrogenase [Gluconobacter kanchanaburiensis NBRC 103587]GEK95086.1 glycerol-3-phosphate dehydrogenase [NAD(P)+] [Gluconobacter kanchanaburiensis NBRC 103587]